MRLTRRGWGTVAVVGFCLWMAASFGSRALNAVVAPLAFVLVAGVITAVRVDRPRLRRVPTGEGYPGERRTVELTVDVESPLSATVRDNLPDGVSAVDDGNVRETTLVDGKSLTYEIDLEGRGIHELGPVTVVVSDVFGLIEQRFEYDRTDEVLVYPRVHDLRGGAKHDLQLLHDAVGAYDREEFDHLREYTRGDSLRDIHWKSAAKRADDELVVKEFVADGRVGSVDLVGECIPGRDDDLAAAIASVATYLLREDVAVGVSTAEGTLEADAGERHHLEVLRQLAVAGPGELDDRARREADVLIQADASGVLVLVDGHEIPFDRLRGCRRRRERRGGAVDESSTGSTAIATDGSGGSSADGSGGFSSSSTSGDDLEEPGTGVSV
ncbi:DUF58 domain-containing protein [Natronosalvus halobius]|uniref:DUF58 domain-containing protein n=1 Tax=Natronosalvus halobius TaxID=2953746 RepID=UPI00209EF4F6|nr:DUF58 domain-containing protein [Natronosalvus halobius]USZ70505.1 DUF58 domain-containing protein [Natronosalvus halobius]